MEDDIEDIANKDKVSKAMAINDSLDLGNINISVTSNKSDELESQHSFHAVSASGQI